MPHFIATALKGACLRYVKYYAFVTFYCTVLSCRGYTFFLGLAPRSHPWTDFNRLWLKWSVLSQGCAFLGVLITTHNFKGFKPPKTPKKGARLDIFQPNWQNDKIAISAAGKIGSTQNFDTVIGPHAWLRGWSRMAKFRFKMADDRHIGRCWRCHWLYGDRTFCRCSSTLSSMSVRLVVSELCY